MILKRALVLCALMLLALTGFSETLRPRNGLQLPGMFEGGPGRVIRLRTDSRIREYDILTVFTFRVARSEGNSTFGPEQERFIRAWFSKEISSGNLPPSLARRITLPPSVQQRLQRNERLPAGLQLQAQPLPLALEQKLPPISDRMHRVILAGHVILLEDETSRIVDMIRDVF
jgi:hypothetical protein